MGEAAIWRRFGRGELSFEWFIFRMLIRQPSGSVMSQEGIYSGNYLK